MVPLPQDVYQSHEGIAVLMQPQHETFLPKQFIFKQKAIYRLVFLSSFKG